MTDKQRIESLKSGNNLALKEVYVAYKTPFMAFAKGFNISDDDAVDVYQDAILALRENAMRGKLTTLKSSLKTYVFSIGKYMIYDKLRAEKKWIPIKNNAQLEEASMPNDFEILFNEPLNKNENQLKKAFKNLGEKCKQILALFYFQDYSLEEIKTTLSYKNKDVLKSQKSRCLKTLKEKMKNGR